MDTHEELLGVAKKLISFNTVSHASEPSKDRSTGKIADWISNYLESGQFKVIQYPYWVKPGNLPSKIPQEGWIKKVNLVATKGGDMEDTHPEMAFSGHMDVMPADVPPDGNWKVTPDPFTLTLLNGRYYARGIADMKLFVATAMISGCAVKASELQHPFAIYITSDEEIGCVGVSQLFGVKDDGTRSSDVPIPKYVVIGEPTELNPIDVHKGYMFLLVHLEGKTGHSSTPDDGRSVVKLALPQVIQCLNRAELKLRFITDKEGRFNPNFPTLNQGVVTTGEDARKNTIAGQCDIHVEIRPVPGQDVNEVYRVIDMAVQGAVRDIPGITATVIPMRRFTPPMVTPQSSLIVQATQELSGSPAKAVNFNTEGGVFNSCGAESVIFGPASISQAHKDDEYAEARYFDEHVVEDYITLIRRICGRR